MEMKMNKWTSRAQVAGMSLVLAVLLIVGMGMEARGQEGRIFSINQVKAEPAMQVGANGLSGRTTMATGRMAQPASQRNVGAEDADHEEAVLNNEKIQEFNNLYFSLQPALYYDQDETLDVRGGELPTVITVHPAAFERLQNDLQNARYDFSVVKLIVLKDISAGRGLRKFLLDTSKDSFPSLDYVVVASDNGVDEMNEERVRSMTQAVDADAESLAHLIFVYDNLTEQ